MMSIKKELELMLTARYPLLYVVSAEEEVAEEALLSVAPARKSQIYFFCFSRGWSDKEGADKGNPMAALARVAKMSGDVGSIFVLKDVATLVAPGTNGQITAGQLPIVGEIKNLDREMARDRRCLVLMSAQLRLPMAYAPLRYELREETTIVDFSLPSIDEISEQLNLLVGNKLKLGNLEKEQLLKACQGLDSVSHSTGVGSLSSA